MDNNNMFQYSSSTIEDGLDFILAHFEEPIWPRTIYTKMLGIQKLVFSKQEAIARFRQANYFDCRINAYPDYTEWQGINRQAPNFIFIDLDGSNFKTEKEYKATVDHTLKNIKEILGGNPTILFTGNGIHIYLPVQGLIFEQKEKFSKFDQPSKAFLRFAEQRLTNNKSDSSHNPSFKSCLTRIPCSYNSKCVEKNNGIADSSTQVQVIQKWDGYRPKISPLIYEFYIWIVRRKIAELDELQKQTIMKKYNSNTTSISSINWIERLLHTPIEDYRKNAVNLILAPYLINIKKMTYSDAFEVLKYWLNRCSSIRRLDFNSNYHIKYAIATAVKSGIFPMRLDTLKEKNKVLYDLLKNSQLPMNKH